MDSFEKAKEWSDLSNSLSKLKKLFEKYDKGPIPEKNALAKRLCKSLLLLAQCLSPDFSMIHKSTIEIYKMILERQIVLMEEKQKESPEVAAPADEED